MKRVQFITFEGCEGVGKSTQIRLLSEELSAKGIPFVVTREPGGSRIAESIRKIILDAGNSEMSDLCELFLYLAARAQHLKDIVRPALDQGKLVICDRYIDSTFAYQGFGKGLDADMVEAVNAAAIGGLVPDLTIFLDLPPESAFSRKGGPDRGDRLELLEQSFHERVYEGYQEIARRGPERFVRIDAGGSKQETHAKIVSLMREKNIL
jgi:dTMP kinase